MSHDELQTELHKSRKHPWWRPIICLSLLTLLNKHVFRSSRKSQDRKH